MGNIVNICCGSGAFRCHSNSIDKDVNISKNNGTSSSSSSSSSSYLIQRLQEVHDIQRDNTAAAVVDNGTTSKNKKKDTLLSFLQTTSITPKGADRLKKLVKVVEEYDRMKKRTANTTSAHTSKEGSGIGGIGNGLVTNYLFRGGWRNKLAGGGGGDDQQQQ